MLGGLAEGKRDLIPGIGGALAVSVRRSAASSSGASEAKPQGLISSAAVSRTGSPVIGASSPPSVARFRYFQIARSAVRCRSGHFEPEIRVRSKGGRVARRPLL